MSIFYTLIVTLVGRELAWGPGAKPPEAQGFYTLNYRQMSMLLYLSCDTGRSRIGVGSGGEAPGGFYTRGGAPGAPGNSGVLGNKLLSDEHAFYTLFGDNGRSPICVGSRVRSPEKPRGFGQ